MPFNGSGVFTYGTSGIPVQYGTDISDLVMNNFLSELKAALDLVICRDGQSVVTQNLSFNNKKLTNILVGVNADDACTITNLIANTGKFVSTVGGTGNAITLTPSPAAPIIGAGVQFLFVATNANTGGTTVNVSGSGAVSILKGAGVALASNDIVSGQMCNIVHDGTNFRLI